ncbi:uncharacterized protein PHALS_15423 [Plasmopara halstedii]|uniref:Uncharacterized protein n=1 Tax=Plasmopara halstedii TaxID=4781 RepID=A0A0P1AH12_PLAHL|nr:uncharacterized protein PHALS_15423 [Plasmopara halstedii]CEG40089.1 hypothetical protein PHALS_15423 [Plasmopara halstedii]|eukprot:XP_024576458.1 hypothetical protein PHALS_15423 [Plasmopara halstedii]
MRDSYARKFVSLPACTSSHPLPKDRCKLLEILVALEYYCQNIPTKTRSIRRRNLISHYYSTDQGKLSYAKIASVAKVSSDSIGLAST